MKNETELQCFVTQGSALLLGTQFAHYHGRKKKCHQKEAEDDKVCPIQNIVQLYRYALAMPGQYPAKTASGLLPKERPSQAKPSVDSGLDLTEEDERESLEIVFQNEVHIHIHIRSKVLQWYDFVITVKLVPAKLMSA